MTMVVETKAGFQDHLLSLYRDRRFEEFLGTIHSLFDHMLNVVEFKGKVLFEPVADACLRMFAEQQFGRPRRASNSNTILHVATEVYESGGHTRLFEDVVAALPEYQHTLVLTDAMDNYATGQLSLGFLQERFDALGVRVLRLRSPGRLDRLHELDRVIERVAPGTIVINAHHFDTVTYGTICGASAPRVLFLHHCDYEPSLGATRDDFAHVDVTIKCHDQCKLHGFATPSLLPMTVEDPGIVDIDWSQPLTGLTCGTNIKFEGRLVFSYAELLLALFTSGTAVMHHVGGLAPPQLSEIATVLQNGGVDVERFKYHGTVPSLSAAIQTVRPHYYMNSHPNGGFKAAIEAIACGLPVIQSNVRDEDSLFGLSHKFADVVSFRTLAEVAGVLTQVSQNGRDWARRNRRHYEKTFEPSLFRTHLLSLVHQNAPSHASVA